jgi:hypothetical protein
MIRAGVIFAPICSDYVACLPACLVKRWTAHVVQSCKAFFSRVGVGSANVDSYH